MDVPLATHIGTAATLYLACVHNCVVKPSISQWAHVGCGRMGLLSGLVSFSLGAFLAGSRLALSSTKAVEGATTLGFAIPMTIGGILQIICQVRGYQAIHKFQRLSQQLQDDSQTFSAGGACYIREHMWLNGYIPTYCA